MTIAMSTSYGDDSERKVDMEVDTVDGKYGEDNHIELSSMILL